MQTTPDTPPATREGSPSQKPPPASSTTPGISGAAPLGVRPTHLRQTETGPGPSPAGGPVPDPLDLADPASTGTHSSAEQPDAAPVKLGKKPLRDVFRGLVLGASAVINQRLARTEIEAEAGVWLMAEDEAAGVADPLASIAGRRAGGQLVNPDVGDLIAAGVAAVGYLVTHGIAAFKLRRQLKHMPPGFGQEAESSATEGNPAA